VHIRNANANDAESIAAIYNDAVLNTTAIWNETVVDVANRTKWLTERQSMGYPVLVAVADDGAVLGYASYGDWRAFEGYRHTVEHSVYVNKNRRGAGVGRTLMIALIERARTAGKHVMVAGIETSNDASIQLHYRLGFVQVGLLKEVGTKFDRWLDLTFLQLQLDSRTTPDIHAS
jgi:L-amino acid N-acyltransferase YncA